MAEVLSETSGVQAIRRRFSSLQEGFTFFDAPGGSQVPDEVGDAIAKALREASANLGAGYATSHRVKAILEEAESKAARFLGCGLCGSEWQTNRVRCPSCGETNPERLPGWQSETHPAARVEACETCQRYVKSVDLTLDARAVPEVDELRSLSLDLWAVERGYVRLEPGLAGL